MKRFTYAAMIAAVLSVCCYAAVVRADDKTDTGSAVAQAKTITGKSACATCEGVTSDGHAILLIDKDGYRWVLIGEGKSYDDVHSIRKQGKTITATLASEPIVKKDSDGKDYKEVKISDVKVVS